MVFGEEKGNNTILTAVSNMTVTTQDGIDKASKLKQEMHTKDAHMIVGALENQSDIQQKIIIWPQDSV